MTQETTYIYLVETYVYTNEREALDDLILGYYRHIEDAEHYIELMRYAYENGTYVPTMIDKEGHFSGAQHSIIVEGGRKYWVVRREELR